jgi:hypothetical protein
MISSKDFLAIRRITSKLTAEELQELFKCLSELRDSEDTPAPPSSSAEKDS